MAPMPAACVHVESLQTAVPMRAVEPGRTRPVAVAAPPLPAAVLQRRTRVVLYYRAGADGSRLWEEALWAKESLSEALANHPEMAGRLRRRADGSWEVKLNDAGARFARATAEVTVEEFLAATRYDKDRRARWEAALAPWADVNAEDPDMCALFYLQVTRFQGDGGYAVGVSCSLMLCDPLSLARFLLSWARTHEETKAQNGLVTNPLMQYASYFHRPDAMAVRALIKSIPLDTFADAAGHAAETVLFRARARATTSTGAPDHHALASACVGEASERLGADKVPPRFSVVVVTGDSMGGMSIETCSADDQPGRGGCRQHKVEVAQWQELGLEELVLRDSKPVHVSYSIVTTGGDEGLVGVKPNGAGDEFLVVATVP
ncbi:uncharacterized protein LOC133895895 [Phragmites australis]|uniref:uncharacterized protein LOC133895895 n=1 Tax=Phragmites australis TaxID=29695 RepID=UPI002D77433B|nr:uncharacterized protein LOC133895895 [Phragmites australis]